MSFWNFLGEFAVFNMICNLFSGKPKPPHVSPYQPQQDYTPNPELEARIEELEQEIKESEKRLAEYQRIIDSSHSTDLDDCDIDELQDRIDELESQLDDCDVESGSYDRIQNEIDRLQDRLDIIEYQQDLQDDADYENNLYLDNPYKDFNDTDFDSDDDW